MNKKLNWGIIFKRCTEKHNGEYTYDLNNQLPYKNNEMLMVIQCTKHGSFEIKVSAHMNGGQRCPYCSGSKMNWDIIFDKSRKRHNNYYTYPDQGRDYTTMSDKMYIVCPLHGQIHVKIVRHIRTGTSCKWCKAGGRFSWYNIFKHCKLKYQNKGYIYDISLQPYYTGAKTKMVVICPIHGEFEITVSRHKTNGGCQKCGGTALKSPEEFEKEIYDLYGDSIKILSKYTKDRENVIIRCGEMGHEFEIKANYILNGRGCTKCNKLRSQSYGAEKIEEYLIEYNIRYIKEKRYSNCRDILPLPFDFYLLDLNVLIEYDGEQHFKAMRLWRGEDGLKTTKRHDTIKNNYTIDNNIPLLRIKYDIPLFRIYSILDNFISDQKTT